MNRISLIITTLVLSLVLGCASESKESPKANYSVETLRQDLAKSAKKGHKGIPEIVRVLEENMETHYAVFSSTAINLSVKHLHELAQQGIYTDEVLPVLVRAIKKQLAINDTLQTAKAIKLLSGVEVGYTEEFVNSYQVNDEPEWLAKIAVWEDYVESLQLNY